MATDPNQRALAVLQNAVGTMTSGTPAMIDEIQRAAREVSSYHSPTGNQAIRHQYLADALARFLIAIVDNCPPGADRSNAIRCARESKHWASAAVALENS